MQDLTVIRNIKWGDEVCVLDAAFDSQGRLCTLIQADLEGNVAEFGSIGRSVPDKWAPHVQRIRWLTDSKVALWPIAPFANHAPYIGTMGFTDLSTISSAFPLDVFADNGFLACTFSEERFVATTNLEGQSDLISLFSQTGEKIGGFTETYINRPAQEQLLEVVHGVLDGTAQTFWFTAYNTNYIWYLSFKEGIEVYMCPLGCSLRDILAITCNGGFGTVIIRTEGHLISRTFLKTESNVAFHSEADVSPVADLSCWLEKAQSTRDGYIVGIRGNLLSFISRNRAILTAFDGN